MAKRRYLAKGDVQTLLVLIITALVAYLQIRTGGVPEGIMGIWGLAVGYFFAQRENGAEREHTERMVTLQSEGRR